GAVEHGKGEPSLLPAGTQQSDGVANDVGNDRNNEQWVEGLKHGAEAQVSDSRSEDEELVFEPDEPPSAENRAKDNRCDRLRRRGLLLRRGKPGQAARVPLAEEVELRPEVIQ